MWGWGYFGHFIEKVVTVLDEGILHRTLNAGSRFNFDPNVR